jgi:uncharacterized protein YigE (DUF2233 family)
MVLAFRLALLTFFVSFAASRVLAEPCRTERSQGNDYIVCGFDLSKTDLRLFWRNRDGSPSEHSTQ